MNQATFSPPQNWLPDIIEVIVTQFAPQQIILFGSAARGETNPNSDLDLLIVFEKIENKRQTAIEIRRALRNIPVSKDILVTTPAEIAEYRHTHGLILRPALREGKVIYARA
ncbi:MAG: nucleotidyltransferase domain-containing protein [Anaerolineales bacterium]